MFFSVNSLAAAVPAAGPSVPSSVSQTIPQKIEIPSGLGTVESRHFASEKAPLVVILQDAHAIAGAQRQTQKLIGYLYKKYRIPWVALEGGSGPVDATLFRSFPDERVKKKIFGEYLQRAEITGPQMAAVFGEKGIRYVGIEDWELYAENYFAYGRAAETKPQVLEKLGAVKSALDEKRKTLFSPELNRFFEQAQAFREERIGLAEFLKSEGTEKSVQTYPHLAALTASLRSEKSFSSEELQAAIRKMAESFQKNHLSGLNRKRQKEFNENFRKFQAGESDSGTFLKFLVRTGRTAGIKFRLTPSMRDLLTNVRTLAAIKGSRLLEELESFISSEQSRLARSPKEKGLLEDYEKTSLLRSLASLEWTHDQMVRYQRNPQSFLELIPETEIFTPALEFYRLALARDKVFHRRLEELIKKQKAKSVMVVAGGFHARGFEENLKAGGYSYAVVMPKIRSLEGSEQYQTLMRGNLSYKTYLKTTFYDGFARAAALKLAGEWSAPDFRRNLKIWRDEVIRLLAAEGRAGDAGRYTDYIDLLFKAYYEKFGDERNGLSKEDILRSIESELQKTRKRKVDEVWKNFEARLDRFGRGLKQLLDRGELNLQNVSALLEKSGQIKAAGVLQPSAVLYPSAEEFLTEGKWAAKPAARIVITETPAQASGSVRSELREEFPNWAKELTGSRDGARRVSMMREDFSSFSSDRQTFRRLMEHTFYDPHPLVRRIISYKIMNDRSMDPLFSVPQLLELLTRSDQYRPQEEGDSGDARLPAGETFDRRTQIYNGREAILFALSLLIDREKAKSQARRDVLEIIRKELAPLKSQFDLFLPASREENPDPDRLMTAGSSLADGMIRVLWEYVRFDRESEKVIIWRKNIAAGLLRSLYSSAEAEQIVQKITAIYKARLEAEFPEDKTPGKTGWTYQDIQAARPRSELRAEEQGELIERWTLNGTEYEIRKAENYGLTPGFDVFKGTEHLFYYAYHAEKGTIHQFVKAPGAPPEMALGLFNKTAAELKARGMKFALSNVINPKMVSLLRRVGKNLEIEMEFGPESWTSLEGERRAERILGSEESRELTVYNKYGLPLGRLLLKRGKETAAYDLTPLSGEWRQEGNALSIIEVEERAGKMKEELRISLQDGQIEIQRPNFNDDAPGVKISYYLSVEKNNIYFPYLQDFMRVHPLTGRRFYVLRSPKNPLMRLNVKIEKTPEGYQFNGDPNETILEFPAEGRNPPARQRVYMDEQGRVRVEGLAGVPAEEIFYDEQLGGSFNLRADPEPLSPASRSEMRKDQKKDFETVLDEWLKKVSGKKTDADFSAWKEAYKVPVFLEQFKELSNPGVRSSFFRYVNVLRKSLHEKKMTNEAAAQWLKILFRYPPGHASGFFEALVQKSVPLQDGTFTDARLKKGLVEAILKAGAQTQPQIQDLYERLAWLSQGRDRNGQKIVVGQDPKTGKDWLPLIKTDTLVRFLTKELPRAEDKQTALSRFLSEQEKARDEFVRLKKEELKPTPAEEPEIPELETEEVKDAEDDFDIAPPKPALHDRGGLEELWMYAEQEKKEDLKKYTKKSSVKKKAKKKTVFQASRFTKKIQRILTNRHFPLWTIVLASGVLFPLLAVLSPGFFTGVLALSAIFQAALLIAGIFFDPLREIFENHWTFAADPGTIANLAAYVIYLFVVPFPFHFLLAIPIALIFAAEYSLRSTSPVSSPTPSPARSEIRAGTPFEIAGMRMRIVQREEGTFVESFPASGEKRKKIFSNPEGDKLKSRVQLMDDMDFFPIGSDWTNQIRLDLPGAAPVHAVIIRDFGGSFQLVDLQSPGGTFVQGNRLFPVDLISLGSQHQGKPQYQAFIYMRGIRYFMAFYDTKMKIWTRYEIPFDGNLAEGMAQAAVVLGRGDAPAVRIQLNDPYISSEHLKLSLLTTGQVFIEDQSLNGTYVNGHKMSGKTSQSVFVPTIPQAHIFEPYEHFEEIKQLLRLIMFREEEAGEEEQREGRADLAGGIRRLNELFTKAPDESIIFLKLAMTAAAEEDKDAIYTHSLATYGAHFLKHLLYQLHDVGKESGLKVSSGLAAFLSLFLLDRVRGFPEYTPLQYEAAKAFENLEFEEAQPFIISKMARMLRDENIRRQMGFQLVGALGNLKGTDPLIKLIRNTAEFDPALRSRAIQALTEDPAKIAGREDEVAKIFQDLLYDRSDEIVIAAMRALEKMNRFEAVFHLALLSGSEKEPSTEIQSEAARIFEKLTQQVIDRGQPKPLEASGEVPTVTVEVKPAAPASSADPTIKIDKKDLEERSEVRLAAAGFGFGNAYEIERKYLRFATSKTVRELYRKALKRERELYQNDGEAKEKREAEYLIDQKKKIIKVSASRRWTITHERDVMVLAVLIGKAMGLYPKALERLALAARFHDLGKSATPFAVLNFPERINAGDSYEGRPMLDILKEHVPAAEPLLEELGFPDSIREIILQHHEKLDGSGYGVGEARPKREEIKMLSKILMVADFSSSLLRKRVYQKRARSEGEVLAILYPEVHRERYDLKVFLNLARVFKRAPLERSEMRTDEKDHTSPWPEIPLRDDDSTIFGLTHRGVDPDKEIDDAANEIIPDFLVKRNASWEKNLKVRVIGEGAHFRVYIADLKMADGTWLELPDVFKISREQRISAVDDGGPRNLKEFLKYLGELGADTEDLTEQLPKFYKARNYIFVRQEKGLPMEDIFYEAFKMPEIEGRGLAVKAFRSLLRLYNNLLTQKGVFVVDATPENAIRTGPRRKHRTKLADFERAIRLTKDGTYWVDQGPAGIRRSLFDRPANMLNFFRTIWPIINFYDRPDKRVFADAFLRELDSLGDPENKQAFLPLAAFFKDFLREENRDLVLSILKKYFMSKDDDRTRQAWEALGERDQAEIIAGIKGLILKSAPIEAPAQEKPKEKPKQKSLEELWRSKLAELQKDFHLHVKYMQEYEDESREMEKFFFSAHRSAAHHPARWDRAVRNTGVALSIAKRIYEDESQKAAPLMIVDGGRAVRPLYRWLDNFLTELESLNKKAAAYEAAGSGKYPAEMVSALNANYSLTELKITGLSKKGKENVWNVESEEGKFILKGPNFRKTPVLIDWEASVLERLGNKRAAQIRKTSKGGNSFSLNGNLYVLYEAVGGEELSWGQVEGARLETAARLLADMHKELETFTPAGENYKPEERPQVIGVLNHEIGLKRIEDLKNQITERGPPSAAKRIFLQEYPFIKTQMDGVRGRLTPEVLSRLPVTVTHGDFHQGNGRYQADGTFKAFDFEYSAREARVRDLANAFEIRFPAGQAPGSASLAFDKVETFLTSYHAINPLTPGEIEILPDVFRLAYLEWIYVFAGVLGKTPHVTPLKEQIANLKLIDTLDWKGLQSKLKVSSKFPELFTAKEFEEILQNNSAFGKKIGRVERMEGEPVTFTLRDPMERELASLLILSGIVQGRPHITSLTGFFKGELSSYNRDLFRIILKLSKEKGFEAADLEYREDGGGSIKSFLRELLKMNGIAEDQIESKIFEFEAAYPKDRKKAGITIPLQTLNFDKPFEPSASRSEVRSEGDAVDFKQRIQGPLIMRLEETVREYPKGRVLTNAPAAISAYLEEYYADPLRNFLNDIILSAKWVSENEFELKLSPERNEKYPGGRKLSDFLPEFLSELPHVRSLNPKSADEWVLVGEDTIDDVQRKMIEVWASQAIARIYIDSSVLIERPEDSPSFFAFTEWLIQRKYQIKWPVDFRYDTPSLSRLLPLLGFHKDSLIAEIGSDDEGNIPAGYQGVTLSPANSAEGKIFRDETSGIVKALQGDGLAFLEDISNQDKYDVFYFKQSLWYIFKSAKDSYEEAARRTLSAALDRLKPGGAIIIQDDIPENLEYIIRFAAEVQANVLVFAHPWRHKENGIDGRVYGGGIIVLQKTQAARSEVRRGERIQFSELALPKEVLRAAQKDLGAAIGLLKSRGMERRDEINRIYEELIAEIMKALQQQPTKDGLIGTIFSKDLEELTKTFEGDLVSEITETIRIVTAKGLVMGAAISNEGAGLQFAGISENAKILLSDRNALAQLANIVMGEGVAVDAAFLEPENRKDIEGLLKGASLRNFRVAVPFNSGMPRQASFVRDLVKLFLEVAAISYNESRPASESSFQRAGMQRHFFRLLLNGSRFDLKLHMESIAWADTAAVRSATGVLGLESSLNFFELLLKKQFLKKKDGKYILDQGAVNEGIGLINALAEEAVKRGLIARAA